MKSHGDANNRNGRRYKKNKGMRDPEHMEHDAWNDAKVSP